MASVRALLKSILVIFFSFTFSCSEDHEAGNVFENRYLPLAIGNYWEFAYIGSMANHPVVREHREVMDKVNINQHEYFLVVSKQTNDNSSYQDSLYYRIASNGYVYTHHKNYAGEAQDFRLNANDGDTWSYNYLNQEIQIKVIDETVDLAKGPLQNCKGYFRDTVQSADEEYTITLAAGIGFVKEYSNAWGGGQKLVSARINGIVKDY